MNEVDAIRVYQREWFERIRHFLLGRNLNVGSGHGFLSEAAMQNGYEMVSLEVSLPKDVTGVDVVLYDGHTMPFADASFDASLATYVLHHTPKPEEVVREMKRVSRKRIIFVEELYRHLPGKLHLAALDFWVNFRAGLKSQIHWNSYLTESRFLNMVTEGGWKVAHIETTRHSGFDEVLWIIDKE